jgi:uncharacterized membrane protein
MCNWLLESEALMTAELVGRLLMVLCGFILAMLGVITTVHSDHNVLGVLLTFSGVVSMLEGLPNHE